MAVNFNIRLAVADDIHCIADVYADSVRQLCKSDYTPEVIAHWAISTSPEARLIAIKKQTLWVAEIDRTIVGYVVSVPGELLALFISADYAGSGIGKALGELGIEMAKKNNANAIKLESTLTAAAFYKKMGFEEVSRGYFTHGQSTLKIPVVNMVLTYSI